MFPGFPNQSPLQTVMESLSHLDASATWTLMYSLTAKSLPVKYILKKIGAILKTC